MSASALVSDPFAEDLDEDLETLHLLYSEAELCEKSLRYTQLAASMGDVCSLISLADAYCPIEPLPLKNEMISEGKSALTAYTPAVLARKWGIEPNETKSLEYYLQANDNGDQTSLLRALQVLHSISKKQRASQDGKW